MTPALKTVPAGVPVDALDIPYASLPVSALADGERRFDGETYLTSGYGIRLQIESGTPHVPMSDLADIWMPDRLKAVAVGREHGVPFLAAGQVFDLNPAPRKWLALRRTRALETRFVEPGWILVTRSGTVGEATIAYSPHLGCVISDDLLRIRTKRARDRGYLFCFLRSKFGRSMLRSSHYGSIVKHLQPEHLFDIPVPRVDDELTRDLGRRVRRVFRLRDDAHDLTKRAESVFEDALGGDATTLEPLAFSASAGEMFSTRRRLDAYHYNPLAEAALQAIEARAVEVVPLSTAVDTVFGVARFKHVYQDEGIPYLDSEDLFKISPELTKFIPPGSKKNASRYLVQRDWLLMACSGQLYGLNGSVVLAGAWHEEKIVSNHVLRIVPLQDADAIRPGYLQMALGHPVLGRPLVLRLGFGSEVPEISPEDLLEHFPVARLDPSVEAEVADLVERAASLRSKADELEASAVAMLESHLDEALRP